jgi:hypothetical protein
MARSKFDSTLQFDLPDGSVVTAQEMLRKIEEIKKLQRTQQPDASPALPEADLLTLLDTVLLLGGTASINAALQWLSMNGRERANGEPFDHYSVRDGLQALVAQGRAEALMGKGTRVALTDHVERLQTLLAPPAPHVTGVSACGCWAPAAATGRTRSAGSTSAAPRTCAPCCG